MISDFDPFRYIVTLFIILFAEYKREFLFNLFGEFIFSYLSLFY